MTSSFKIKPISPQRAEALGKLSKFEEMFGHMPAVKKWVSPLDRKTLVDQSIATGKLAPELKPQVLPPGLIVD
jgi:hypothetical protein